MVHAFNEERFREVVAKGQHVASLVTNEASAALDEYLFRRIGLGLATLVMTVLAISLYLYIRRIERRQTSGARNAPYEPHR